ncbi:MAG: DUF2341 domain-containing protein [Methanomassiliicoccales archaeon]|nr:MAG: DUF2341 domain-containing protein [Methanomassiliicoccales archaeon]
MDEVRISKVAHTAAWIVTEYNNQNDTASFLFAGREEIPSTNWLYRKTITINSSKVTSDLTNFPVLINITDSDLASKARSDGYDIAFYGYDGSLLDHETEYYSSGSGKLIAWVRVPSVLSSVDTEFYMYYGKSDQATTMENPHGVWDVNYTMVQHLNETSGTHYDSTQNGYDGTEYIDPPEGQDATGKIDGADEFDGTNDYINISTLGDNMNGKMNITFSFWIKTASDVGNWRNPFSFGSADFRFETGNPTTDIHIFNSGINSVTINLNGYIDLGEWNYLTFVSNEANWAVYIDGVSRASGTTDGGLNAGSDLFLGVRTPTTDDWKGIIDEIRISDINRSVDWITTEYNNMNDTSSFLYAGSEENVPSLSETSFDEEYEWVELYNPSSSNCTLNDLYLSDYDGNLFDLSGGGVLPAGGYLICHLGESGTNSSTHVYGPIINYYTSTKSMLAIHDDLSVKSSQGYIFDYVAWGAEANTDDSYAVDQGVWTDGEYVNATQLGENVSMGRDKHSRDLNNTADWENPSNLADPYGIHAADETPGAINFDQNVVINEVQFAPTGDLYGSWCNRKKITINSSKVTADLTNFPVLINLTDSDLARRAQADGGDIMFIASDETTKYNHEIESFDSSTGELIAWVNITYLSSTTDTEFYMYYNNPAADNQWNVDGTWDADYVGVWHLNEDGDGDPDEFEDSSQFDNHGQGGSGTSGYVPSRTDAKVGYGQDFDGEDDHIDCGYDESLDMGGKQITLEAWINFEGYDPDHYIGIMSHAGWSEGYRMVIRDVSNPVYFHLPEDSYWVASDNDLPTDSWVHVVAVYNGSKMFVYVNGVKNSNEDDKIDDIEKTANDFWIGHGDNQVGQTWSYPWNGSIDEVRVSNFTRSADWIATEYNNQNDTSTFYNITDEEFFNDRWLYRKNITINSSQVESDLTNFPVLISITDSDLANKANIDGNDIYFTKSDGTTRLNHEVESYESTSGELVAWVNVTSLSSSSDTYIYMYYGNPNCFSIANTEGVWDSNYVGVWHLSEMYGTIYDSTSNDMDGSSQGHTSTGIQGKIDSTFEFNGSYNNSVIVADDPSLDPSSITVECWWNTDLLLPNDDDMCTAISKATTDWSDGYYMGLYRWDGDNFNGFMFFSDLGTWIPAQWDISNIAVGSWYYAAGTYNSSADVAKLFINGTEVDSASSAGAIVNTDVDLGIGSFDWVEWDGKLDEIRISNIVRSDAWLDTTFNTQYNTSTFISVGSEEASGASPEYEWVELCNKGSTAINVSGWYITDNDGNKFYITGAGEIPAGGYLVCHLAESGTNSSTNVYGPIISEDTVTSLTWELGPANCKDTGIWINEPNRNIGYDGWMELMDWDSATAVDNGLFQFDLSIFSSNDIIDANLWLYRYDGSTSYDGNFSACRVTQSWTETGATWNTYDGTNNWYMAGGDFNPDIYDYVRVYQDNNGWYKWNITGLMDGWKDGTYPNYGMILVGNDEADWWQLRSSDHDVTALRPQLIINYTVPTPTQYFMLENTDDLTLYDGNGNMIDYLAWGADVGADDDSAAAWRQWTAGDYIDSSSLLENQTLGRDQNENDTDEPEDWQNASDKADPFGIDRSTENGSSPNACNVDFIIPEFEEIVIPFAFMILIAAVWRRKRYKKK